MPLELHRTKDADNPKPCTFGTQWKGDGQLTDSEQKFYGACTRLTGEKLKSAGYEEVLWDELKQKTGESVSLRCREDRALQTADRFS